MSLDCGSKDINVLVAEDVHVDVGVFEVKVHKVLVSLCKLLYASKCLINLSVYFLSLLDK